jgi:glycosyltransferase involved in cell wall biosynthesis
LNKRIKLGLIFTHNEQWVGGSYYILNLISALNLLPNSSKPTIIILSNSKSDFDLAKQTGYPYIQFKNPYDNYRNIFEIIIDKCFKISTGKYVIDKRINHITVDVLFPANNDYVYQKIKHKIFWFPDFQHIGYPSFFDKDEINNRNSVLKFIADTNQTLVISSNDAKAHWHSLNITKNCKTTVIPFAVTHPLIDDIDLKSILNEFKLEDNYFMISNQFWVHKNHMVILKAIKILKESNIILQFVFTGLQNDYRHPNYFNSILSYINEHNLSTNVKLLGLIDRPKQLVIMKNATAVIQPSLFEGWSTVIEDAKLLNCNIIASDIAVHKEQLIDYGASFFMADDAIDLADKIKNHTGVAKCEPLHNYKNSVLKFANAFNNLISEVCQ